MPVELEAYGWASELPGRDLEAVTRIFNQVWDDWLPGDPVISTQAYVDFDRFSAPPERMERRLARVGGDVVGHGVVYWRETEGGGATLRLFVDRDHRRAGVGTALGRALASAAREAGRVGINLEVVTGTGAETAVRSREGLRPDLVVELNRTEVRTIDCGMLERWREVGERAPGYSLVTYDAPCPEDDLARDFVVAREVMNDAPRPEGVDESTYTVDELRAVEAASAAAHQEWWNVGVRHDATGELVGLTELYLPANRPWMASQGDTGVRPDHRGHGLGAWMKAVNHLRLADDRPEVEWVHTWNAESNEPMLRINRALGFAPRLRFVNWYAPFPPLP